MRRIYMPIIVLLSMVSLCYGDWKSKLRNGLPITISIRAEDEHGQPVSNATCYATFQRHGRDSETIIGKTDSAGFSSITGKCSFGDIPIQVYKDGYYGYIHGKVEFLPNGYGSELEKGLEDAAKRGYWIPKESVIEVRLKKKGNPIKLWSKTAHIRLEQGKNRKFWMDLHQGSITNIAPKSSQKNYIEILYSYESTPIGNYTVSGFYDISLNASDSNGGFAIVPKDEFSTYSYPTKAPNEDYDTAVVLAHHTVEYEGLRDTKPSGYAIYRTVDANGEKEYALFIDFSVIFRGGNKRSSICDLLLTYYLFPPQNGDNIEFEGFTHSKRVPLQRIGRLALDSEATQ